MVKKLELLAEMKWLNKSLAKVTHRNARFPSVNSHMRSVVICEISSNEQKVPCFSRRLLVLIDKCSLFIKRSIDGFTLMLF